jgi:hypothetical protein
MPLAQVLTQRNWLSASKKKLNESLKCEAQGGERT